jgi:enoyl-CoA hydratase
MQTPTLTNLKMNAADGVLFLRINRPAKRNALDATTRAELIAGLDWAARCDEVRVVVIAGEGGKSFAAGADLSETPVTTALQLRETLEGRRVYDAVNQCSRPVVAMIDGYCLGGGCELALSADIRVASQRSKFGLPEIRLGIIPGGGGTQRLPRLIGLGHALRLVLSGELLDAEEAHRLGLVELVVGHDELEACTRALCASIAGHSPIAVKLAKQALRASVELPLSQGLVLERELLCLAFTSEDSAEGIRAFLEKRKPIFRGR